MAPSEPAPVLTSKDRARARRISYFMLFRLAMLAGFTVLAGAVWWSSESPFSLLYSASVWGTLVIGYILTIVYARMLPAVRDLERFAIMQTGVDIVLAALVVELTGGVESGFVTLYLIAVLGAATMGGYRQTWVASGIALAVYLMMSSLQALSIIDPLGARHTLEPLEFWGTVARTSAALVGVSVLSSYLTTQLATSVSQVGNLRALNENIVRSLTAGLLTTDLKHRILYFNPAARSILDLEDEDIGKPIDKIMPGLFDAQTETGAEGRQDLEVKTRAGRELHIGLNRVPLLDAEENILGYVINFQDVTRLHELAGQVRRNERLAALGGMAASVAHEIRNPLAAISGSAELLSATTSSPEDQRLLRVIERESTRLSRLITELLQFTRPRAPQPVRLDVTSAIAEACESFKADPANARLDLQYEGEADALSEVDPAQFSQVIWNLLKNAADAMNGEGRIRIRVHHAAEGIDVDVRDWGPGMPPEVLERVFDPFFTTKETGTGFGLAIVHRVVEDNGGSIRATSRVGEGTTFRLRFPRHEEVFQAEDSGVLHIESVRT